MVEPPRDRELTLEPLAVRGVGDHLGVNELQGDGALEPRVGRPEDDSRGALPDDLL